MQESRRSNAILLLFVFIAQLIMLAPISWLRLVDGDEGFCLMASRLVTEQKVPYHDFLLTQMPLLPYVYGWWMRLAGMTWHSARLLSSILAAALGTALYTEVRRQTGKRGAGLLAALLFISSTLVFAWLTLVETYALSTVLLFLAYRAAIRYSGGWLFVAGLLFGASVDVRLFFGGLLPVFVWWIYSTGRVGDRARASSAFLVGCAGALLPNLYLVVRDPRVYFWDNLGFHALRSDDGLIGDFGNKIGTAGKLFVGTGDGNGVQMTILAVFIVVLAFRSDVVTRTVRLALTVALVLGLISTPAYVQDFSATIPFLILFVACSTRLLDSFQEGREKRYLLGAYATIALIFVVAAAPDFRRFLMTGDHVLGIVDLAHAPNWRISGIREVSRAIDKQIRPGERVMSLWPGYMFESKAEPYAGLENNSATHFADTLSAAERARYHILSPKSIQAKIAAREPRLVVIGNRESMQLEAEPFERALPRSGYKVARKVGVSELWTAEQPSSVASR